MSRVRQGGLISTAALLAGAILLPATGCSQARPEPELQIVNVLNAQADAWNRGNLDGFMSHYWASDDLTFSAGGTTTRGWAATLARYQTRYPGPDRMGRLEFDELEIRLLGEQAALVLGRWRLQGDAGRAGGNFSLIFERVERRWVITHDHTSTAPLDQAPASPSNP